MSEGTKHRLAAVERLGAAVTRVDPVLDGAYQPGCTSPGLCART